MHITSQLNYAQLRYLQIERKFMARSKIIWSFLHYTLAKVAAKWQLRTFLFQKSQGENKSHIRNFSRYFSCKEKKFSSKCDCIGRKFKPYVTAGLEPGISGSQGKRCRNHWAAVPPITILLALTMTQQNKLCNFGIYSQLYLSDIPHPKKKRNQIGF